VRDYLIRLLGSRFRYASDRRAAQELLDYEIRVDRDANDRYRHSALLRRFRDFKSRVTH